MFKFIALFLWFDLLQLVKSEVELSCTNKASVNEAYCPGDKVIYECNTTHKFLEWTVKGQEVDFSVIDHPGAVEVNTRCDISGVLLQYDPFFSSQLTFSAHEEFNNTRVQCLDGLDGKSKGCIFEMKAPPDTPHSLNVTILNITSVLLEWVPPSGTNHNELKYRIEATPTVPCDHCGSYEKIVEQTSIQINGIDIFAGYEFSLKSLNCNGSLESIPVIQSVTPLTYYINVFYDSCSIHFFLNFTWEGPATDTISLIIQLEYENVDNMTELLNKTARIPLRTSEDIIHVEFNNLKPEFFYQWVAVLYYDHKYMTLSAGSFNSSSTCSHDRKKNTFRVATVAISGSMVVLIIGVAACVVVFGICFWFFWCKKHRTCSTKMEPLETRSEQIPLDKHSPSNQSFVNEDHSNEDRTSYETLDDFPVDSKSKESSLLFYNAIPIEDMLCVSNGTLSYQSYGDITKI